MAFLRFMGQRLLATKNLTVCSSFLNVSSWRSCSASRIRNAESYPGNCPAQRPMRSYHETRPGRAALCKVDLISKFPFHLPWLRPYRPTGLLLCLKRSDCIPAEPPFSTSMLLGICPGYCGTINIQSILYTLNFHSAEECIESLAVLSSSAGTGVCVVRC